MNELFYCYEFINCPCQKFILQSGDGLEKQSDPAKTESALTNGQVYN